MPTKRKKRPTDAKEYLGLMERLTRNAASKRVNEDGIDALHMMADVSKLHEEMTAKMVAYLLSAEGGAHSWADIAEALGISRQLAMHRYKEVKGVRRPGGQPANLR